MYVLVGGVPSLLGFSLLAGKWASACPDSLPEVARDGNEVVKKPFLPTES